MVKDKDGRTPRGPPGSALLLYMWRWCAVWRSPCNKEVRGMQFLFVLSYPRLLLIMFLSVLLLYSIRDGLIVFYL